MPFCNTCMYWEKGIFSRDAGKDFGICHHTGVALNVLIDGKTHLKENGMFYTSNLFGCIYHRTGPLSVIDIKKALEE